MLARDLGHLRGRLLRPRMVRAVPPLGTTMAACKTEEQKIEVGTQIRRGKKELVRGRHTLSIYALPGVKRVRPACAVTSSGVRKM